MEQKVNGARAWYVIHTYSGYENKVKANLEKKISSQGLDDVIFDVVVPMHTEVEIKNGKKRMIQRKIFPGYVLIDMIVNNYSWYVVRNTQGVTGFVGSEKTPIPLSPEEAERILNAPEELRETLSNKLKVNDQVRIIAGWFVDYEATVKEIDEERQRLKVLVENTPVDLEFRQVEKI